MMGRILHSSLISPDTFGTYIESIIKSINKDGKVGMAGFGNIIITLEQKLLF